MSKKYWEEYYNAIKKQDWEKAKNSLEHLSKIEQKNPQVQLKIGDIYQRMGDTIHAIAAYHNSEWILKKQGFIQKALALYKIILRLDSNNSEAINSSKDLMMELESSKTQKPIIPSFDLRVEQLEQKTEPGVREYAEIEQETEPEIGVPAEMEFGEKAEDESEKIEEIEKQIEVEPTAKFEEKIKEKEEIEIEKKPEVDIEKIVDRETITKFEDFIERTSFAEQPSVTPSISQMSEQEGAVESKATEEVSKVISDEDIFLYLSSFFSSLPENEIKNLVQRAEKQLFSPGEMIVEEGDSGDSIFFIRSGRAKVISHILGREIELAILSAGDMFGEVAFLTGRPRTASVFAYDEIEVIEFNKFILEEIFAQYPDALEKLHDFYHCRVEDTLKKVKDKIKKKDK
jgi:CRP-like cAMP-binding protein